MQAHYLSLSFSHKNTPIALREQLALDPKRLACFIAKLGSKIPSLKELLLLNTCNRVEFYIYTHAPRECLAAVLDLFATELALPLATLESHCKSALDEEAVHHVFSVVSGLDSIVLGETQIVAQMKAAYKQCFELGSCAQELSRLMHFAFRTAAKVRTETAIAKSPLSIASVAVRKSLESKPKCALVLGAGEMASLAARHLLEAGVAVYMSNRTRERALRVASMLLEEGRVAEICHLDSYALDSLCDAGALDSIDSPRLDSRVFTLLDWQDLPRVLNCFPVVLSATAAQGVVIEERMCEWREARRIWLDLAVPRDIEAGCARYGVELLCVDDLQQVIAENRTHKEAEAQVAYSIVGRAVMEYFQWLASLDVLPLIKALRQQAKEASQQELARAIKKGYLPGEFEEEVLRILHNAFNVFLHTPTLNLKELASHSEGDTILQALQQIFTNDDKPKLLNRYKCEYDTTL